MADNFKPTLVSRRTHIVNSITQWELQIMANEYNIQWNPREDQQPSRDQWQDQIDRIKESIKLAVADLDVIDQQIADLVAITKA